MKKNRKWLIGVSLISSAVFLAACQTPEPLVAKSYVSTPQMVRAWKRLQAEDIAVAQVRVAKRMDLECAGRFLPIAGSENYKNTEQAFSAYWAHAVESDLSAAGLLNQKDPKVKLYNLIDSVKIIAEPTRLVWIIKMEVFSSNGHSMRQESVYNAPTGALKDMQEGCKRLSDNFDKAVSWSILKMVSDPRFEQMVEPGLNYVPSMKAESLRGLLMPEDENDRWKSTPTHP